MILSMVVAAPAELMDRSHIAPEIRDKFTRVTGIAKSRRWWGSTTELAIRAAEKHRNEFPAHFHDLDAVIVVTQSPDRNSPAMAVEVHHALGLPPTIMAFDVNQSCDGFLYGLSIAASIGRVLLVCADRLRAKVGTPESMLFSDGAVSAVVEPSGFAPEQFFTDGAGAQFLSGDDDGLLCMNGGKVFDFVTACVPKLISDYDERFGRYDFLAQHQPNLSMMNIVEKKAKFNGRSLHSVAEYGNMSMVSVAAALASNEEKILGKSVLLCAYGAGWCAALMGVGKWPSAPIARVVEI